jgi:hypothetical protein
MNLLLVAHIVGLNAEDKSTLIILHWPIFFKRLIFVVWSVRQITAKRMSLQRPSNNCELLVSEGLSFLANCVLNVLKWRILNRHECLVDARVQEVDFE